jgi:hypothetical protein
VLLSPSKLTRAAATLNDPRLTGQNEASCQDFLWSMRAMGHRLPKTRETLWRYNFGALVTKSPKNPVVAGLLALALFLLAHAAAQVRPRPAASPIELTRGNLDGYLERLTADREPASYVIREKLTLTGTVQQWKVNNLTFERDGAIFIGSTNLTILIKGVIGSQSKDAIVFASFPEGRQNAASGLDGAAGSNGGSSAVPASPGSNGGRGADGQPGADGSDSGDLTLQLRQVPSVGFRVVLRGQNGGRGGVGGRGGDGGTGQKGRPGESGVFDCKRGGDNGGAGGGGGDGGNGGTGGRCGSGGKVTILTPSAILRQVQDRISVDTSPALPGDPGAAGPSGRPGLGGQGGDGSGFCGGGNAGAGGPVGRPGVSPSGRPSQCKPPSVTYIPID